MYTFHEKCYAYNPRFGRRRKKREEKAISTIENRFRRRVHRRTKRKSGGGRKREQRTEEEERTNEEDGRGHSSFDSVKPRRVPHRYGWLCKQDGRKVDRIARSRVTIIYLPAGPERRVSLRGQHVSPRPTKTPTQKFAWASRTFYARTLVGAGGRASVDEDRIRAA